MERQGGDTTMVGSSIVLLQERFKRLQRTRERREERELLRLFSDSEQGTPTKRSQPVTPYQPETIFPSTPPLEDSLSLGLNLYGNHADVRAMKAPALTNSWSADAAIGSTSSRPVDNSDVDTSLHL